jgi:hypothetical protein
MAQQITKTNLIAKKQMDTKSKRLLVITDDDDTEDLNENQRIKSREFFSKNAEQINAVFNKCVKCYHLMNSSPIKESLWEDVNAMIFSSSGIEVYSKSDGGHSPGMDICCALGNISNKSVKYASEKKSIDMSSYRLTSVCSENNCGTPAEIIQEINKRKNFGYYSIIARQESVDTIQYDWILIPSNYELFVPGSYNWKPTLGKKGKNKDAQVGWHTNDINGSKMTITFSMSSQLWIHIEMTEEIKKFIIASAEVSNKPLYNYIEIYDKLT